MRSSSKLSAALVLVLLSTGILAPSAFALDRDGSRPANPVVRFIHYVRSFIVSAFEEIAVPKP